MKKLCSLGVFIFLFGCDSSEYNTVVSDDIDDIFQNDTIVSVEGFDNIRREDMKFAKMMMTDNNPYDDAHWTMVYDHGGITEFENYEREAEPKDIKELYERYGLEYVSLDENSANAALSQNIGDRDRTISVWGEDPPNEVLSFCGKYFGDYHRNRTFAVSDIHGYTHNSRIDGRGRPWQGRAEFTYFTSITNSRDKSCTDRVGKYGYSGDEGGHLIAAEIGGWPKRLNLVPQDFQVNRSIFRLFENAARACSNQWNVATVYRVTAHYRDRLNEARPSGFTVTASAARATLSNPVDMLINAIPFSDSIYIPNGDISGAKRDTARVYRNDLRERCGLSRIID